MQISPVEFAADIRDTVDLLAPLYDELTTSDLQGICEARAISVFKSHFPGRTIDFGVTSEISDNILEGIYDRQGDDNG